LLQCGLETKKTYFIRTKNYKAPRIYRGADEWFVEYYYRNPFNDKWDRFKIRGQINYEKDLTRRNQLAILL
jgi:hypothetical protein